MLILLHTEHIVHLNIFLNSHWPNECWALIGQRKLQTMIGGKFLPDDFDKNPFVSPG